MAQFKLSEIKQRGYNRAEHRDIVSRTGLVQKLYANLKKPDLTRSGFFYTIQ